jgi:FtsP/CotA-like multicopper oxidase with cupredoxin domain
MNRPCWQASTFDYTPNATAIVDLSVPRSIEINGDLFNDTSPLFEFGAGELIEMNMLGQDIHPFHIHQYHFQIVSLEAETDYFHIGDWHDTLHAPSASAIVRFYTNDFSGTIMMHCESN